MPLEIVERLALKGAVSENQTALIHLRANGADYHAACRVQQPSPPSYHMVLVRKLMSPIIPGVLRGLTPGGADPVIAQPIDIGGQLVVYVDGKEVALPGVIVGIEVPT